MDFVPIAITGGMLVHFYRCANISRTINWDYNAETNKMITDLKKEKERSGKEKIRLGITWLYEPTVTFYRVTKKINWLEKVNREGIEGTFDYYFITKEDEIKVRSRNIILIKEYPVSKSWLMK